MDNALKDLELKLESLSPRGLSDEGRKSCHQLIDQLVDEYNIPSKTPDKGDRNWIGSAAAAATALGIGISGGWYLGMNKTPSLHVIDEQSNKASNALAFEHLDREKWIFAKEPPNVYVTKSGEIREISREVEVTEEVVQHRESGVVVTIETTDHHVVDAPKSDF